MAAIGLVLGGGGPVGHGFDRGVLAALEDCTGFDARTASVIVGTSSGAVTAALLRSGLSGRDLAAEACGHGCPPAVAAARALRSRGGAPPPRPRLRAGTPASPRGALAALRHRDAPIGPALAALLPAGSVPTTAHGGPLEAAFGDRWPSAPLWLPAVCLDDGERVVFGRAGAPPVDVATAVAASCALPGCFAPVSIDGRRYVDGAAWSTSNADLVADLDLDLVIITAPLCSRASWFHRVQRRYLHTEVQRLRAAGHVVATFEATVRDAMVMGADLWDRSRRDAVVRRIRRSTEQRLRRGDLRPVAELIRSVVGASGAGPTPERTAAGLSPTLVGAGS